MSAVIACSHCSGHAVPDPHSLVLIEDIESGQTMNYTVSDLIPTYLREKKALGEFSHSTTICARSTLFQFAGFVGGRKVQNIGPSLIDKWLISLEHLAPATRRERLSKVRGLFTWAIRRGYCKRNPAAETRGPKQPRTIPRALNAAAIRQILDACPDARARLIIILMIQQGLRCIEVSRLSVGDLDMNAATMRVVGKGGHERILPIMEETTEAIVRYLGEHPASAGPLVRSYVRCRRALTSMTVSTLVSRVMADSGVKQYVGDGISAHAGRHTAATDMLLAGAHLRDVQFALGHAHLTTTERYLPHLVKGLDEAMGGRRYGK